MKRQLVRLARDLAGDVLAATRITAPLRHAKGRLTVATFHRVLPEDLAREYPYPVLAMTPEQLDWCLGYFREHFTCGPLTEVYNRYRAGESPDRPFLALTFDDGQRDNVVYGGPVLERHGVKATFYVPVAGIERRTPLWHDRLGFALLDAQRRGQTQALSALFGIDPATAPTPSEYATWVSLDVKKLSPAEREAKIDRAEVLAGGPAVPDWSLLMTWDEAAQLARDGHEIGSHSMTHPLLPQLDERALEYEIIESRRLIADHTGQPVDSFCYPNGDHDERIVALTRRAGYANAVTADHGRNNRGTDAYRLRRFDIMAKMTTRANGAQSASRLDWWISGLYPQA